MSSFFESAPQVTQPLSSGSCDLPIHYRDGGWCGLFYRVALPAAQALCTGLDIEPWPIFGAAVAAIYAWEYRDSSVGSYGEVGIGLQVRRRGARPSVVKLGVDMSADDNQGIWVASLPVTTQAAFDAGVELWNYPKYVTPITTRFDASGAHVRLGDELELTLGGVRGFRRNLPVVTYTARQGVLLRTHITTDCLVRLGLPVGASLKVLGDGPSARIIQALGMAERSPLAAFHTNAFRAILPLGKGVGPSHTASHL